MLNNKQKIKNTKFQIILYGTFRNSLAENFLESRWKQRHSQDPCTQKHPVHQTLIRRGFSVTNKGRELSVELGPDRGIVFPAIPSSSLPIRRHAGYSHITLRETTISPRSRGLINVTSNIDGSRFRSPSRTCPPSTTRSTFQSREIVIYGRSPRFLSDDVYQTLGPCSIVSSSSVRLSRCCSLVTDCLRLRCSSLRE